MRTIYNPLIVHVTYIIFQGDDNAWPLQKLRYQLDALHYFLSPGDLRLSCRYLVGNKLAPLIDEPLILNYYKLNKFWSSLIRSPQLLRELPFYFPCGGLYRIVDK